MPSLGGRYGMTGEFAQLATQIFFACRPLWPISAVFPSRSHLITDRFPERRSFTRAWEELCAVSRGDCCNGRLRCAVVLD